MKPLKHTAILVDGGFYRRMAYSTFGDISAAERANELEDYCWQHIRDKHEYRKYKAT